MSRLAIATYLLLLSALTLNAGTATPQFTISKDPQAISIAQKALAAMGGAQAILNYQDSQATGRYTLYADRNPVTFSITIRCKGTQKTRVEIQKPNGATVRIVNQGQGVIERPIGTVVHLLMNNTSAERINHIPLFSILGEYQNGNISLQYQGTAQVSSRTAMVVALSLVPSTDPAQAPAYASMTQTLFYTDQITGLVDKIQFVNHAENDPNSTEKVEIYFTDWRIVNGISVPYRQTTYTDGNLGSDLVLESVEFNLGLLDSEFMLPQ